MKEEIDSSDKYRWEQRILKDLPIEVEKHVRGVLSVELDKLRHELGIQTNNVGEQLMSLKA